MIGAVLGLVVLADARDAGAWKAIASEQVAAVLRRNADGSLCLEYDFHSVSGYAVMRRPRSKPTWRDALRAANWLAIPPKPSRSWSAPRWWKLLRSW